MSFRLNRRLKELANSPDTVLGVDPQGQPVLSGPWLAEVLQVSQLLEQLTAPGLQIYSQDSLHFFKFFVAACIAGKKIVLIPNQQPLTREHYDKIFPLHSANIDLGEANASASLPPNCEALLEALPDLDLSPIILWTSGTTGAPKEVQKKVCHFINEVQALEDLFDLPQNATLVSTVSHQHVYGLLFRMWWPFMTGRRVLSETFEFPEQFVRLQKTQPHLSLVTTPSFLKRLDQDSGKHLQSVAVIFSSGGPLPPETSQNISRWLGHFPWEIYGSTESGGVALRKGSIKGQPPWTLFPDVTASRTPLGRLTVQSPFFSELKLEMGDDVQWVSETEFQLLGRADRILKIEETRISLEEMEAFFSEHTWVESACLFEALPKQSKERRQELWGVVQLTPLGLEALAENGRFQTRQCLRQHLKKRFPLVVLPRRLRYVDEWPYNSVGKLNVKNLHELFDD